MGDAFTLGTEILVSKVLIDAISPFVRLVIARSVVSNNRFATLSGHLSDLIRVHAN
jgi:hypothetical protein